LNGVTRFWWSRSGEWAVGRREQLGQRVGGGGVEAGVVLGGQRLKKEHTKNSTRRGRRRHGCDRCSNYPVGLRDFRSSFLQSNRRNSSSKKLAPVPQQVEFRVGNSLSAAYLYRLVTLNPR